MVNGHGRMKRALVLHGKHMVFGRQANQIGMLQEVRPANESYHRMQFRRWVIIAIVLFVTVQSLLWASLDEMAHAAYLSTLAFVLNPVFTYCMIGNLSFTASRNVRIGLCTGCWIVYPVGFMFILIDSSGMGGDSTIGLAMHVMFDKAGGILSGMESPVIRLYIVTTALCSIGALAGALLCYLSDKLADGVRKVCKRQLGSQ